MGKYRCIICGYVYDPEKGDSKNGILPGTDFDDLPEEWRCPTCRQDKTMFKYINDKKSRNNRCLTR